MARRDDLAELVLAVDLVLLALEPGDGGLRLLLVRRLGPPYAGAMALPGAAVRVDETLEQAARRALVDKAGLDPGRVPGVHLEQLFTFDALYRDPRGRTVSVAYLGLTRPLDTGSAAGWRPVQGGDDGLPFDHNEVLACALARLRGKLRYTNLASRLLPDTFRIEELQGVYEGLLGQRLNRTNFRNKLLKIGLIQRAGVLAGAVGRHGGRPPHLYRFADQGVEALDRDFL